MIAVVLAGGYAKRLWPLSIDTPKALLPVRGKTVIDYILQKIQAITPPVSKIIVSTNLRFQSAFEEWLHNSAYDGVALVPDNSRSESEKIGAVRALTDVISEKPNEEYLVLAGDSLFSDDLSEFMQFFKEHNAPVVAVYKAKDLAEARRSAVITLNGGRQIIDCVEKPENPPTKFIGACLYAFPVSINQRLREYLSLGRSQDQPGKFIEWLWKVEPVYGFMLNGSFLDIGTLEAYREAENYEWESV